MKKSEIVILNSENQTEEARSTVNLQHAVKNAEGVAEKLIEEIKKVVEEAEEISKHSFAAGLVRSVTRTITRAFWFYFQNPLKLFRPSVIETLHLSKTKTGAVIQVDSPPNSIYTIYHTLKRDGLIKFLGQVMPAFTVNVIMGTAMFGTYDGSKLLLTTKYPLIFENNIVTTNLIAGASAGLVYSIFTCPLDAVNLQIWEKRHHHEKTTLFRETRLLYQERGLSGMYRLVLLTVCRDTLGLATFFTTFELAKQRLTTLEKNQSFRLQNPLAVLASGALAGLAHQAIYHPIEVLKRNLMREFDRRHQLQHATNPNVRYVNPSTQEVVKEMKNIIEKKGIRFLFRGYLSSMTRAMPPAALAFLAFEAAMGDMNKIESDSE